MEWLRLVGARLSVGLLSAIVILTFWVIHLNHDRQVEMRRAVSYAAEVSESQEAALSTLKDAEMGERGYIITGQTEPDDPAQPHHLCRTVLNLGLYNQQIQVGIFPRLAQRKGTEQHHPLRPAGLGEPGDDSANLLF